MLHRLIALILIIAAVTFVAFNFQAIHREIAYKFNINGVANTPCCKVADILRSNGNFDDSASVAIFDNQIIDYPKTSLSEAFNQELAQANDLSTTAVLGVESNQNDDKWIEVSLSEQKVRAWEGTKLVMEYPISSGKWGPTPTGNFRIWYKIRSTHMVGGDKALGDYYDLPNVPDDLFFYQGYALHGAYWHNNFGHPMSHGCVNEPLVNAAQIFEWAGPVLPPSKNSVLASADNPGTRVYVHK